MRDLMKIVEEDTPRNLTLPLRWEVREQESLKSGGMVMINNHILSLGKFVVGGYMASGKKFKVFLAFAGGFDRKTVATEAEARQLVEAQVTYIFGV